MDVEMNCNENISGIKIPKKKGLSRVPVYPSSSGEEEDKSSGDHSFRNSMNVN